MLDLAIRRRQDLREIVFTPATTNGGANLHCTLLAYNATQPRLVRRLGQVESIMLDRY
nr:MULTISPECIES: hypothetical protein [unclassified Labrenzia]